MNTARTIWLTAHRWLGLTAGLLFVLLGLTGSLLVFDHAIDEWLNPELLLTEGTGPQKPLVEVLSAAERAMAGAEAESVTSPRVENGVWIVWFQTGTEDAPSFTQVCVDPDTAEVTGKRVWGEYLMSWIYRLHFRLLAGETGATIVGLGGLLMMISVCSGIYLWWPLWKNGLRAAFAVRNGKRFNYDLHKTTGICSAALLFIIAFTGVYMTFPDWVKPLVTVFSKETPRPADLKSTPREGQPFLTPEQAIVIAQQQFPDATFDHFHPPQGPEGVYEIGLRQPGEVQRSFGRTQVWLDPYSGRMLAVRNPDDFTAADTFVAWQFPLHNGEAFGLPGRWIVFCTGLAPAILYVTGVVLWWRKGPSTRRRNRRSPRTRPVPPVPAQLTPTG